MNSFLRSIAFVSLFSGLWVAARSAPADAGPVRPNDIVSSADVDRLVQLTFAPRQPPVDLGAINSAWQTIVADATRAPIRIIFDTDLGTDVDDAITLMFTLSRPEFDVLAITTSRGEVGQRAAVVSRLLQVMGRTDIPFAAGSPTMVNGATLPDKPVNQFPFAGPEESRPRPAGDAQELFRRAIEKHPGEVWLVVLGPMTNAAILLRDHPELAAKLRGIVCMGGELNRASAETNFRHDPLAAQIVCRSGLLKFIGTDEISIRLLLPKPDLDQIARTGTPMAEALVTLCDLWRPQLGMKPGPVMFDVCPMLWLLDPGLFTTRSAGVAVDETGISTITADAPACVIPTDLHLPGARRLVMDTLTRSPAPQPLDR